MNYPAWQTFTKRMERSTIFEGEIHYFDWAIFNSYVTNYQRVKFEIPSLGWNMLIHVGHGPRPAFPGPKLAQQNIPWFMSYYRQDYLAYGGLLQYL